MTPIFAPGDRVHHWAQNVLVTYMGADVNGMARIRWDDATEAVVNPSTLEVWPYPPEPLIPRAEVRRIHTDHGSPSFPQIDGPGWVELIWVELIARDYREMAEDSPNALRLEAIADDLDKLISRYKVGADTVEAAA